MTGACETDEMKRQPKRKARRSPERDHLESPQAASSKKTADCN
jgi:hypothetical protein